MLGVAALEIAAMTDITVVYRNDGRTLEQIKKSGFESWNKDWHANDALFARTIFNFFLDRHTDISKLPEPAQKLLKPTKSIVTKQDVYPKFLDVMTTIKTTLKGNGAYWVSTAVNRDAGGRNEGHLFEIRLPRALKMYRIEDGRLRPASGASAVNPALYLDAANLDEARIFAFVSGPDWDAELSFFTQLNGDWISEI